MPRPSQHWHDDKSLRNRNRKSELDWRKSFLLSLCFVRIFLIVDVMVCNQKITKYEINGQIDVIASSLYHIELFLSLLCMFPALSSESYDFVMVLLTAMPCETSTIALSCFSYSVCLCLRLCLRAYCIGLYSALPLNISLSLFISLSLSLSVFMFPSLCSSSRQRAPAITSWAFHSHIMRYSILSWYSYDMDMNMKYTQRATPCSRMSRSQKKTLHIPLSRPLHHEHMCQIRTTTLCSENSEGVPPDWYLSLEHWLGPLQVFRFRSPPPPPKPGDHYTFV